jgi:hypothetical protein
MRATPAGPSHRSPATPAQRGRRCSRCGFANADIGTKLVAGRCNRAAADGTDQTVPVKAPQVASITTRTARPDPNPTVFSGLHAQATSPQRTATESRIKTLSSRSKAAVTAAPSIFVQRTTTASHPCAERHGSRRRSRQELPARTRSHRAGADVAPHDKQCPRLPKPFRYAVAHRPCEASRGQRGAHHSTTPHRCRPASTSWQVFRCVH